MDQDFWNNVASKIAEEVGIGERWWELNPVQQMNEKYNKNWTDYSLMLVGQTPIMFFRTNEYGGTADYVMNLKTFRPTLKSPVQTHISTKLKCELEKIVPFQIAKEI